MHISLLNYVLEIYPVLLHALGFEMWKVSRNGLVLRVKITSLLS